jgi:hypothetical protein
MIAASIAAALLASDSGRIMNFSRRQTQFTALIEVPKRYLFRLYHRVFHWAEAGTKGRAQRKIELRRPGVDRDSCVGGP